MTISGRCSIVFVIEFKVDGAHHLPFRQRRGELRLSQVVAGFQVFFNCPRGMVTDPASPAPSLTSLLSPNHTRWEIKVASGFDWRDGFIETEAPCQQFFSDSLKTNTVGFSAQHYRDKAHIAPGRGRDRVVARAGGGAGFNAIGIEVGAPQQTVAVWLTDFY